MVEEQIEQSLPAAEEVAPPPAASSAPPAKAERTIALSGGRVATLGRATGRHLIKASVLSGGENQFALLVGVVSLVARIDGQAVAYEDLLDMDAGDLLVLVGSVLGNVPSLGLGT